jgi:RHS repeat-associated protein
MGCLKLPYNQGQEGLEASVVFLGVDLEKKGKQQFFRIDYYPFGLTAKSYTRSAADPTKYLYNGGVEQNDYTSYYETFYRNYDASIGRFMGVDIKAASFSSQTPYQYAFNDPVSLNDPLGDAPMGDLYGEHSYDESRARSGAGFGYMDGKGTSYRYGGNGRIRNSNGWYGGDVYFGNSNSLNIDQLLKLVNFNSLPQHSITDVSFKNGFATIKTIVWDFDDVPNPDVDFGGWIDAGGETTFSTRTRFKKIDGFSDSSDRVANNKSNLDVGLPHFAGLAVNVADDVLMEVAGNLAAIKKSAADVVDLRFTDEATKLSTTASWVKWGGRIFGAYSALNINEQHSKGQISDFQMVMEQGINYFSVRGGYVGAAAGVGWEIGRAITQTDVYQEHVHGVKPKFESIFLKNN